MNFTHELTWFLVDFVVHVCLNCAALIVLIVSVRLAKQSLLHIRIIFIHKYKYLNIQYLDYLNGFFSLLLTGSLALTW